MPARRRAGIPKTRGNHGKPGQASCRASPRQPSLRGVRHGARARFIVMYFVMFTMIATLDHLYLNLNNVYMTLMMVAPMALIMLVAMRSMFTSPRLNWIIGIAAVVI